MKEKMKKMMATILVLVMAAMMLPPMTAQAAAPKIQKETKFWIYNRKNVTGSYYLYIQNPTAKGKITKLKNSKPSVAKVYAEKNCLRVELKSAGTTKVTFRYAGKNLTTKINIKKWESPCKEFKIGNKNYAKYFEKSGQYNLNRQKKNKNEKINIVPKKGWKLTKIEVFNMMQGTKKVKNKSKVKFSVGMTGTGMKAYFKNKKTGEIRQLYFGYSGQNIPSENIYNYRID